jgi:hypothetical protein
MSFEMNRAGELKKKRMQAEASMDGQQAMNLEKADEDLVLEQTLRDFKASITAWSEAELSRPRAVSQAVQRRSWRLAAGWALGLALLVGGVSGGVVERHRQQVAARVAAEARVAEQQRQLAEQKAQAEEEDLLAKVDSDVSREVPSAMEPLAQLMAEDETR